MINYYELEVLANKHKQNRFLNKIFKLGINVIDIKSNKDSLVFKVSYQDYLKIKDIKTVLDVNIIGIKGIKKVELLINKYKIFLIFFALSIFLVVFLSNFVFFIEIDHEKKEVRDLISHELKDSGITLFSKIKSYDELDSIKNKIKNNNKDQIEWIEINRVGVTYTIKVIERVSSNINNESKNMNIVASKNGLIIDMYVDEGEIIKNKGDYVNKGDIIVSGVIKRNETIVDVKSAKALVYAEVWYKVKVDGAFKYKKEVSSTMGKRSLIVNIFGKDFKLFSKNDDNLGNNSKILFHSPNFSIKLEDKVKVKEINLSYSEDELLKILEDGALKKINEKLNDNEKVLLQKTLKKTKDNDRMYIEVFFKVYEEISSEREITDDELKILDNQE